MSNSIIKNNKIFTSTSSSSSSSGGGGGGGDIPNFQQVTTIGSTTDKEVDFIGADGLFKVRVGSDGNNNGSVQVYDEANNSTVEIRGTTGLKIHDNAYSGAALFEVIRDNGIDTDKVVINAATTELTQGTASRLLRLNASKEIVASAYDEADMATKAYADSLVIGLIDDRGNYDASSNLYPSTGGSGVLGAILKGDLWTISVSGILNGITVTAGDAVRALTDTPSQTAANWAVTENNIGYVPENTTNKVTTITGNETSTTKFPVVKAILDYLSATYQTIITYASWGNFLHAAPNKKSPVTADEIGIWNSDNGLLNRTSLENFEIYYDSDAQLYFNESTTDLPITFKKAVNWFVLDLKTTGNWDKINFMFIAFTPNQTLARTNLKNPTHKLTEMVSSGWVANAWWLGNGARYLKLNWTPSVDGGTTFTQNNAGFTVMLGQHGILSLGSVPFGSRQPSNYSDTYLMPSVNRMDVALNSDSNVMTSPKSGGVISITRDNGSNFKAWRQGVFRNTMSVISKPLSAIEWTGLAWNNNGTVVSFTTNKIMLMAAHKGDIDVNALNTTIKGMISGLNGGYKMTTINENIPGMAQMDSCLLGILTESKFGIFGGYKPGVPFNTTNEWFTSIDNGVTWVAQSVMPFRLAHAIGGLRTDGFYWVFGYDPQVNKLVTLKINVTTDAITTVNSDLKTGDLSGLTYVQWGYIYNDEIYAAMSPNGVTIRLYKTSNGTNWSLVSTFPANYAINSSAYVSNGVVRVAGGCRYAEPVMDNFITDIYESLNGGITWSIVRALPAEFQSAWPSYFKFNNEEFFITGRNIMTSINEGFLYKYDGENWINTNIVELSGRHAISQIIHNNSCYFANGYLYNDFYKLDYKIKKY